MRFRRRIVAASGFAAVALSLLSVVPAKDKNKNKDVPADTPVASDGLEHLAQADLTVVLSFSEMPAGSIFEALHAASGVTIHVPEEIANKPIAIDAGQVSLKDALTRLGTDVGATYRVVGPSEIEVLPILRDNVDGVTLPKLIPKSKVTPEFPMDANGVPISGKLVLMAVIDRTGAVRNVETLAVRASGFSRGEPSALEESLVRSATKAVKRWRYEPATRNGAPVAVYSSIVVDFSGPVPFGSPLPVVPTKDRDKYVPIDTPVASDGLERLAQADLPFVLSFDKVPVGRIFEALQAASGVTINVPEQIANKLLAIDVGQVPLKDALTQLGTAAGATYRVVSPSEIEVLPILIPGLDGVTLPELISAVPFVRSNRIEGQVTLAVVIDRTGAVRNLQTHSVSASGYEGNQRRASKARETLVRSATTAVKQWRYEPSKRDGEPVDAYFTIVVDFRVE